MLDCNIKSDFRRLIIELLGDKVRTMAVLPLLVFAEGGNAVPLLVWQPPATVMGSPVPVAASAFHCNTHAPPCC